VLQESGSRLRWVAGALDGVFGHHRDDRDAHEVAGLVLRALIALTEKDTDGRARALYSLLKTYSARQYVDALLSLITQSTSVNPDRVHAVSRWLATEAPDREPVKAAIAILGVVSRGEDRDLLLTLGKHEEFTLFSAVALQRAEEHPDPLLWQLAQDVTGWGRIHVVERLAATRDDRIKSWLVREGCRNDIMDEYTALVCAKSGELVSALRPANPDEALMQSWERLVGQAPERCLRPLTIIRAS
jgi:hypothetical protein